MDKKILIGTFIGLFLGLLLNSRPVFGNSISSSAERMAIALEKIAEELHIQNSRFSQ